MASAEEKRDESMAAAIAKGISEGMAQIAPPRKVSFGEYARLHARKVKLTRNCYQNGVRMDETVLSDKEINLLNQIKKSGDYIDHPNEEAGKVKLVEVVVKQEGSKEVVHLNYDNAKIDHRMDLKSSFRNLGEMLNCIVREQEGVAA